MMEIENCCFFGMKLRQFGLESHCRFRGQRASTGQPRRNEDGLKIKKKTGPELYNSAPPAFLNGQSLYWSQECSARLSEATAAEKPLHLSSG